jgi:hypothetical protein
MAEANDADMFPHPWEAAEAQRMKFRQRARVRGGQREPLSSGEGEIPRLKRKVGRFQPDLCHVSTGRYADLIRILLHRVGCKRTGAHDHCPIEFFASDSEEVVALGRVMGVVDDVAVGERRAIRGDEKPGPVALDLVEIAVVSEGDEQEDALGQIGLGPTPRDRR